jgi:thioester reductase-like protein
MESIFQKLEYWAKEQPNKLLYCFLDINGNETEKYSYSEFVQRIDVIASHLRNNYKFKKNDRLLLAYPPGLEMICAFFACSRAGYIPVPVYPPTSHGFQAALDKITYIAKDSEAVAVLTSKDYYWSMKLNLARNAVANFSLKKNYISKLDWIITEDFRSPHAKGFTPEYCETLFIQYTSGSTSNPKGVIVTHENIIHNGTIVTEHVHVSVSWLPQYHDMGLIGYYLYMAVTGGTTYGFSPMDFIERPALWLESMSKYKATASSAPNFAYEYCLRPGKLPKETFENLDLSSLKVLMTAAEPVRANVFKKFLQTFEVYGLPKESFFAAFGLAEFTLAVSSYGRTALSVNKNSLKINKINVVTEVSEIASATQIMSCGTPLGDTIIKIVDTEKHTALEDGNVGEVWLAGKSKCLGYWKNPEMTQKNFNATIVGENVHTNSYLRTGDMGFMHEGELYICGRSKDMIIIRGINYYPQDIEKIVEESSPLIRKGCTAAFEIEEDGEEKLIVVAEVKNIKDVPNPTDVAIAVRKYMNIQTHAIIFIAPRSIPKTSSGKIARHKCKMNWLDGSLKVVKNFADSAELSLTAQAQQGSSPFDSLKVQYNLKGDETFAIGDVLDSLDLVVLMHDIKELLKEKGATTMAKEVDIRLVQKISVSELFELANQLENASAIALVQLKTLFSRLQQEHQKLEIEMMIKDARLLFEPAKPVYTEPSKTDSILLTGGTGFFGPFLLKSLLEQNDDKIYVLVRAKDETQGKERLRTSLYSMGKVSAELLTQFEARVIAVCGDLSKNNLGLAPEKWNFLANNIHTIYNNGAIVNYLFSYEKMREANVLGTNEILKLAFDGKPKIFNHISTTFIFGWATKDTLFETDRNAGMELLDFGYSQTKWVSEQIVHDAMDNKGLKGRVFRPALISPSVDGGGSNFDISIRLLAFMLNHGIDVNTQNQVSFTPADIGANNIVAISNQPDSINRTFHVTNDRYANMMHITEQMTLLTGQTFTRYDLKKFVPEIINRCTKDDLLFPLLDFLVGSVENISAMEFKLYSSENYKTFRNSSKWGIQDPNLTEIVGGILTFMQSKGIVAAKELSKTAAV